MKEITELIIHDDCGLPIELCPCENKTLIPIPCPDCDNNDECKTCEGYGEVYEIAQ